MRKIAILITFALLALSSCTVPRLASFSIVDFSKYAEQGFLITPTSSISQEYESIGIVTFTYREKYSVLDEVKPGLKDVYDVALDNLVESAKEQGANAILDFKVREVSTATIQITGFAVKITK